jgi:hypothetical protein
MVSLRPLVRLLHLLFAPPRQADSRERKDQRILHCRQQPGEAPPVAGDDAFARLVTPRLDPLAAADPDAIYRGGACGEDPGIEKPVAAPLQKDGWRFTR